MRAWISSPPRPGLILCFVNVLLSCLIWMIPLVSHPLQRLPLHNPTVHHVSFHFMISCGIPFLLQSPFLPHLLFTVMSCLVISHHPLFWAFSLPMVDRQKVLRRPQLRSDFPAFNFFFIFQAHCPFFSSGLGLRPAPHFEI